MRYIADTEWNGRLLRDYIKQKLGISGRMTARLKKSENGILVNGKRVTVRCVLKAGDAIELAIEDCDDDVNENVVPCDMPLDIVYEDDSIIVVNKAPYVPTHPSFNHYSDSLANGLAYYFSQKGESFVFRAVNRLDADTSGLVLVAKNKDAAYKLSKELQSGLIEKKYIAVLDGVPENRCGTIETYIRRKNDSIILREVCEKEEGAAYAKTEYETLCSDGEISLVKASPITGRTHQLRVHFSYIGCPLCDDDLYGCVHDFKIGRHALHAYSLGIIHPVSGEQMRFSAPVENVPDLKDILEKFGGVKNV